MGLKDLWQSWNRPQRMAEARTRRVRLRLEELEDRTAPSATASLSGTDLLVNGLPGAFDRITVNLNATTNQLVVADNSIPIALFNNSDVKSISVQAAAHLSIVRIDPSVLQPVLIQGGTGVNFVFGGGGPATIMAGTGGNRLAGGNGDDTIDATVGVANVLSGGGGNNTILTGPGRAFVFGAKDRDTLLGSSSGNTADLRLAQTPPDLSSTLGLPPSPNVTLSTSDVSQLLQRAAAATASDNAIVAVVDRQGRILGVRVEGNVSPAITGNTQNLVFSVDGAVAEARTAAFFANNQAPLTPRTIQFISQTTITQREVESDPSIQDPNSPLRGPGFVAPVGIHGHFPPNVPNTPQVDLVSIEGTNRDTTVHVGPSGIGGAADGVRLPARFNIDPAFIPTTIPTNEWLAPPDSYGFLSGLEPGAQPRGIGTLPGGIPIFKNNTLVGGIGVFFPGNSGFATEENSSLASTFDPSKPDLSVQAEYIAFAAVGGSAMANATVGTLAGIAPVANISLPFGRIDLVGITLPLFGPGTPAAGPTNLVNLGNTLGIGDPNSGFNAPLLQRDNHDLVTPGVSPLAPGNLLAGVPVPEGFLVTPHNGAGITASQVSQIIANGVQQAVQTRAAIRLPLDSTTRMVLAVSDTNGTVVGLFRMPDATVFSIDVAVAKSRNVAYYANPAQLQPIDEVQGVPPGVAFTNRTFRFLALPFFPEGVDGAGPGPFSVLTDGGTSLTTATNTGLPLPASAFQSAQGHDAFNPETNFHDPFNILNQNGVVFFPGSSPLYDQNNSILIGGFGVSGDGVDQDDVVTTSGQVGFEPPPNVTRADQVFVKGVRLPYQKTNRQPLEP
jgi:uncharacterized protein GlcG (DUF336 family)